MRRGVLIFVFCLMMVGVVSSITIGNTDKMDFTEKNNLENLLNDKGYAQYLIENEDYYKAKIENDEVWALVGIRLKDDSGVEMTDDRLKNKELIEQQNLWYSLEINETLDDIIGKNINLSHTLPYGFMVWANEAGIEKILSDDRVEEINFSDEKVHILSGNDFSSLFVLSYYGMKHFVVRYIMVIILVFLFLLGLRLYLKFGGVGKMLRKNNMKINIGSDVLL